MSEIGSMNTEELQEIVEKLAISQAETARQMRESQAEAARQMRESQAEADRQMREYQAETAQAARQMRESQAEMKQQMKETNRQVGAIGNKFGFFTEGFAFKSVAKILRNRFRMESVGYAKISRKGRHEEYDLLGYSNGGVNKGVIVEVKSKLDTKTLEQMERKMDEVFEWLPEHRDKVFEGVIAYVHAEREFEEELQEKIQKAGWHLISIGESVFQIEEPEGFAAREYRYGG